MAINPLNPLNPLKGIVSSSAPSTSLCFYPPCHCPGSQSQIQVKSHKKEPPYCFCLFVCLLFFSPAISVFLVIIYYLTEASFAVIECVESVTDVLKLQISINNVVAFLMHL